MRRPPADTKTPRAMKAVSAPGRVHRVKLKDKPGRAPTAALVRGNSTELTDADDNHKTPKKRGGRAGPLSSTYKRKKQEVIDYMDAHEAEIQDINSAVCTEKLHLKKKHDRSKFAGRTTHLQHLGQEFVMEALVRMDKRFEGHLKSLRAAYPKEMHRVLCHCCGLSLGSALPEDADIPTMQLLMSAYADVPWVKERIQAMLNALDESFVEELDWAQYGSYRLEQVYEETDNGGERMRYLVHTSSKQKVNQLHSFNNQIAIG